MTTKSAREEMAEWAKPAVHVLDEAKAARLGAKTMLMPSPLQVQEAVLQIPAGQTKTIKQLRLELAASVGAGMTCPVAAKHCWRVMAHAAEEARGEGATDIAPWWRLTLDGKPNSRMPGGADRHRELAIAEGILLG